MTESFTQNDSVYNEELQQGLKLSGENKAYFVRGRLNYLREFLPRSLRVNRVLDFGCGVGETSAALSEYFPGARVTGVDLSDSLLGAANKNNVSPRVEFQRWDSKSKLEPFELCYTNGVFHHIEPSDRLKTLNWIYRSLCVGGVFAFFENNPWNPGTRLVMKRIPFDRDAKPLSIITAKKNLTEAGFKILCVRTLFYFPSILKCFRGAERFLSSLPFGAQYLVLVQK